MASVKLDKVRKVYDPDVVAVHGASFDIEDGEFVVLVGPSGCGKSTTLRMIAGLESISAGDLYIGEAKVNDMPPKDRDIAMVFQNYALYPHMTVRENMAFGLKLRKYDKAEINNRVSQAAEVLGITPILDRKPKQLSGGQRQRVAVGRAIVRKPKVFLFDEPLSNLDAKLRVQMRTEISKLHQRLESTMVYVTHDQVEAMTMGDRIVVMKDGLIQQIDSPLNLYDKPANKFVAGFIGSPSMNFMHGMIQNEGALLFCEKGGGIKIKPGSSHTESLREYINKDIVLGFRPEAIYVSGDQAAGNDIEELSLTLDVLEPMGNEIFVYASSQTHEVVARVVPQQLPEPGNPVSLSLDMSKLHFFDAESGNAIR
ncbi:MAG: ABC transporter ATP-binding protein [Rhodothermales bacterium]